MPLGCRLFLLETHMLHMFRAIVWFLVRLPLLVLIFVTALVMSSCTMLGLNYASLETANKAAPQPALNIAAIMSEPTYRTGLMQSFEEVLYGPFGGDTCPDRHGRGREPVLAGRGNPGGRGAFPARDQPDLFQQLRRFSRLSSYLACGNAVRGQ